MPDGDPPGCPSDRTWGLGWMAQRRRNDTAGPSSPHGRRPSEGRRNVRHGVPPDACRPEGRARAQNGHETAKRDAGWPATDLLGRPAPRRAGPSHRTPEFARTAVWRTVTSGVGLVGRALDGPRRTVRRPTPRPGCGRRSRAKMLRTTLATSPPPDGSKASRYSSSERPDSRSGRPQLRVATIPTGGRKDEFWDGESPPGMAHPAGKGPSLPRHKTGAGREKISMLGGETHPSAGRQRRWG